MPRTPRRTGRITVRYAELTDEGQHLRITFNRPLSQLEADGLLYRLVRSMEARND